MGPGMAGTRVHALNVGEGDCFILERAASGRVSVVDICGGNVTRGALAEASKAAAPPKPHGDYGMRNHPCNPLEYMDSKGMSSVFRFILTHPDMDHMDGIQALFKSRSVWNYWDCGTRREKPDFGGSPYLEADWDYYEKLIAGKVDGVTVVRPRAGSQGKFWSADDDDHNGAGDYISVVAPCGALVDEANDCGDVNDASYVVVYRSCAGRIIFAGDSNDKTWEYILEHHENLVSEAAVLFAPHHGRKSGRSYSFLDVVKPRVSFFGCASSEHLAYDAWRNRGLLYFTANQCGNAHIYPVGEDVSVFIENEKYAQDFTRNTTYKKDDYSFLCSV